MDIRFVPVTEYWFARRFPVGSPRNAMAPVHWKGYAIVAAYVTLLVLGGMAFAWLGASGELIKGAAIFAAAAIVGAGLFIVLSSTKGDKTRTVADYVRERRRSA
jgi:uncharacterized membrane protein